MVEARSDSVISLFVGAVARVTRKAIWEAQRTGQHWTPVHFRDIHHVVCLIWPVEKAAEFLEWAQHGKVPGHQRQPRSDDAIVGYWARTRKQTVWATVPSLVEHEDLVPSTIHRPGRVGRDSGRRAIAFVAEDPREIDFAR